MKKMKKIGPVDTLSLVDKVELRLMQYFKENNLKPGDPISREIDLSESLGVSRTVVREALLRLRTLGFIESKKHRGMIFKEPDIINNFERILDPTLLGANTLKSLFELRLILEMGMADFLFEYKTKEDLEELENIVRTEEETSYDKTVFSLDKEIAFHGKLYQISKNTTLQRFQDLLLPVFEYLYQQEEFKNNGTYAYSSGKFVTHRMLLDNLKVGTPETFRNAMRRHLEPHFDRIFNSK
ncbi:FadR/GntR family transcriptional regulator [Sinomicrobium weinanense]|uniref:FadR family transcriptional regulator n=1 Tax=Sinomicrobium weinanense TaxID=2842200 RepID=A0A926JP96_9FLAO|nr:FCD domain-containing protein [Sinomicrobium weinanense]MBC9794960.1 FadR family transcriptional regulator [Sinomicrobium weinanense]MBU3125179.1 FCD domain-containing protein [Sinomicrobium weinanense]